MAGELAVKSTINSINYGTFEHGAPPSVTLYVPPAAPAPIPAPPPAPAAVLSWGRQFANYFNNWSMKRKILTVAGVLFVVAGAAGTTIGTKLWLDSKNVKHFSADEICTKLPLVAATYLQWTLSSTIYNSQWEINQCISALCGGNPVTGPGNIAAIKDLMTLDIQGLTNQSTKLLTGNFFPHGSSVGLTDLTYEFIYGCQILNRIDVNWLQNYIPLLASPDIPSETLRNIVLGGGLKTLCGRLSNLQPTFTGSTYSCGLVENIGEAIKYIASYKGIWP